MFGPGGGIVKVWDTFLLTLNPTISICHWLFGVGGGIVQVWETLLLTLTLLDARGWHVWGRWRCFQVCDTFLLTITLLDACGWHVWGGWRRRQGKGPVFAAQNPFLCMLQKARTC